MSPKIPYPSLLHCFDCGHTQERSSEKSGGVWCPFYTAWFKPGKVEAPLIPRNYCDVEVEA